MHGLQQLQMVAGMTRCMKAPASVKLPELVVNQLINYARTRHRARQRVKQRIGQNLGQIKLDHVLALVLAFPSVQRIAEFVHN